MARPEVFFEQVELGRPALETAAKFFGPFEPAFPAIVGHDGAVDLDAQGPAAGNGVGGKAFGIGAGGHGRPGNPLDLERFRGLGDGASGDFRTGNSP